LSCFNDIKKDFCAHWNNIWRRVDSYFFTIKTIMDLNLMTPPFHLWG